MNTNQVMFNYKVWKTPVRSASRYEKFSLAPRIITPLMFEVDTKFSSQEIIDRITETVRKYGIERGYNWDFKEKDFRKMRSNTWTVSHTEVIEADPEIGIYSDILTRMEFEIHVYQKSREQDIAIVEFQDMNRECYITGELYREIREQLCSPEYEAQIAAIWGAAAAASRK